MNTAAVSPPPDTYTRATTLQFSGTAAPDQNVTVLLGTATVGTGIADGQGAWTANVPLESADGEYTYRVDFGGHGRDVRVFVDRTQPAPAVAAPAGPSQEASDPHVRCRGRADRLVHVPSGGSGPGADFAP